MRTLEVLGYMTGKTAATQATLVYTSAATIAFTGTPPPSCHAETLDRFRQWFFGPRTDTPSFVSWDTPTPTNPKELRPSEHHYAREILEHRSRPAIRRYYPAGDVNG